MKFERANAENTNWEDGVIECFFCKASLGDGKYASAELRTKATPAKVFREA